MFVYPVLYSVYLAIFSFFLFACILVYEKYIFMHCAVIKPNYDITMQYKICLMMFVVLIGVFLYFVSNLSLHIVH